MRQNSLSHSLFKNPSCADNPNPTALFGLASSCQINTYILKQNYNTIIKTVLQEISAFLPILTAQKNTKKGQFGPCSLIIDDS
jgi:hypothetical protein